MNNKAKWWAVWSADYPEEGSIHYRARTEKEALAKARRSSFFRPVTTPPGMWLEAPDLVASPVTSARHRQWMRNMHAPAVAALREPEPNGRMCQVRVPEQGVTTMKTNHGRDFCEYERRMKEAAMDAGRKEAAKRMSAEELCANMKIERDALRAERDALKKAVPQHELSNYRIALARCREWEAKHNGESNERLWDRVISNALRLCEAIDRAEKRAP